MWCARRGGRTAWKSEAGNELRAVCSRDTQSRIGPRLCDVSDSCMVPWAVRSVSVRGPSTQQRNACVETCRFVLIGAKLFSTEVVSLHLLTYLLILILYFGQRQGVRGTPLNFGHRDTSNVRL